ncbi:MAG: hypothetical protein RJP95_02800 [Pirellulales bacterium]
MELGQCLKRAIEAEILGEEVFYNPSLEPQLKTLESAISGIDCTHPGELVRLLRHVGEAKMRSFAGDWLPNRASYWLVAPFVESWASQDGAVQAWINDPYFSQAHLAHQDHGRNVNNRVRGPEPPPNLGTLRNWCQLQVEQLSGRMRRKSLADSSPDPFSQDVAILLYDYSVVMLPPEVSQQVGPVQIEFPGSSCGQTMNTLKLIGEYCRSPLPPKSNASLDPATKSSESLAAPQAVVSCRTPQAESNRKGGRPKTPTNALLDEFLNDGRLAADKKPQDSAEEFNKQYAGQTVNGRKIDRVTAETVRKRKSVLNKAIRDVENGKT